MWQYLLILIFLNNINCYQILEGKFGVDSLSSEYITSNNDILIYEPKSRNLYISKSTPNSRKYQVPESLKLNNTFNKKDKPEILYFNFANLNYPNEVQVSYFNEEFRDSFIFGKDKENYSYISIEEIGKGNFAILLNSNENSTDNNSLNIATFDFQTSNDDNRFNITKTYILGDAKIVHSNCITIKENIIVCALTEKTEDSNYYYYKYKLILLNNENEIISDQKDIYSTYENIYNYDYDDDDDYDYDYDDDDYDYDDDDYDYDDDDYDYDYDDDDYDYDDDDYYYDDDDYYYDDDDYYDDDYLLYSTKFIDEYNNNLIYKFFKIINLDNEKFLYCYMNNDGIYCGLAEIKNSLIEVLYKATKIFNSFSFNPNLARNTFDVVKYKDDKIGLSLATYSSMNFALLKLKGNSFDVEKTPDGSNSRLPYKYPFYSKLLKNNNNELILFMLNGDSSNSETLNGYIDELEIITCSDTSISIYNADKEYLKFNVYPSFIIDKNIAESIYLFNIGNELNSIFYNDVPIKENTTYNKEKINYNFSSEDYNNYIKNTSKYEIGFSGSLEEDSQKCKLTINFKNCKKECEFCNNNNKCWDENWKFIYFKSDFEKIFFIFPVSILVMLIVLIFFTFAKCFMREQIPNYGGGNLIQNEMPLIT